MLKVKSFDEAMNILEHNFARRDLTVLPITEALNMALAGDVYAGEDIPPYDRSTMDGYAVFAADTFGASASLPAMLDIGGAVEMGEYVQAALNRGQAFKIPTGGMLPQGADSVVMVEYTEELDKNTVLIEKSVSPLENVIKKGEDIQKGALLFAAGHFLRPQDIGALCSLGIQHVPVCKSMRIGILSTGNEIVDPFGPVAPGKIRDINTYAIAAAMQKDGLIPHTYGIIKDEFESLTGALKKAFDENDAVIISGGSSVGIMDMTLKAILSLEGAQLLIEGIALKPGKPTIAASVQGKPVFGLPGHPVSAFVLYHAVVAPLFAQLSGRKRAGMMQRACFYENYATQPGRDEFIMVRILEEQGKRYAKPVHAKSGMFVSITGADGIVRVPASKEGLYEGEEVDVQLF